MVIVQSQLDRAISSKSPISSCTARLDLSVPAFVEYLELLLLLMLGLRLTGYPPVWPLRTGASDLIGIVLTVILVLFVNSIIYLMKKVR